MSPILNSRATSGSRVSSAVEGAGAVISLSQNATVLIIIALVAIVCFIVALTLVASKREKKSEAVAAAAAASRTSKDPEQEDDFAAALLAEQRQLGERDSCDHGLAREPGHNAVVREPEPTHRPDMAETQRARWELSTRPPSLQLPRTTKPYGRLPQSPWSPSQVPRI